MTSELLLRNGGRISPKRIPRYSSRSAVALLCRDDPVSTFGVNENEDHKLNADHNSTFS